jgi:hypothetical protein
MKKTIRILAAVLLVLGTSSAWAQAPDVTVSLSFNKTYYNSSEPIVPTVTVTNNGGALRVNQGFGATVFYRELKITDPAGRVLGLKLTQAPAPHGMYPVPFFETTPGSGLTVPASPCESLASSSLIVSSGNIRSNFDFSLPGKYMAQVQVSMMVYKTGLAPGWCQLDDFLWQGGLESQVVSFYVEGRTSVQISPSVWSMKPSSSDVIKVRVYPDAGAGLSVKYYTQNAIYLNSVASKSVTNQGVYLEATYNAYEALQSLGAGVQAGQQYPVRISGWMRDGGFFGGTGKVSLTGIIFEGFFSPIDNQPIVNSAKAGQTVPVKWRITNAAGAAVSDPSSFKDLTSNSTSCSSFDGDPLSAVEEYAAGNSGLQYLGNGNWQFNWKTPKSHANSCRVMTLTLKDGSTHNADFRFK